MDKCIGPYSSASSLTTLSDSDSVEQQKTKKQTPKYAKTFTEYGFISFMVNNEEKKQNASCVAEV